MRKVWETFGVPGTSSRRRIRHGAKGKRRADGCVAELSEVRTTIITIKLTIRGFFLGDLKHTGAGETV